MSLSEVRETLDCGDNEQISDFENFYLLPEYFARESFVSTESIREKWRKVPRSPLDFSKSATETSSCRDSDYQAWLENYYKELLKNAYQQSFADIGVDTSDLLEEKEKENEIVKNIRLSEFQPHIRKWSYSTKYWGPNQVRRHWALERKKGDVLFLPSIHPILNLRSRYGRFHSQLNSAAAVPELVHKTFLCGAFKKVLDRIEVLGPQLLKMMLCDNLCNLKWFDFMTKATTTKSLCRLLRSQFLMSDVSIENASLEREEGIIFLCALSQNAGSNIKELHIWKMFGYGQCPVLLNELTRKGKLKPAKPRIKFLAKIHFLQILNKFSNLMSLSVNYAYLANQKGDVLLCLKSARTRTLKELRILCLMNERPLLTNPGYGVGGCKIPDGVWRRIAEWNPDLHVHFVFLNMPQYENVILFLSKNIPMSHVYISSGIDLTFEVPWDIDSTLLELRNWYSSTLQDLSLHLWRHRDLLDFVIRKKILEEFPSLVNFEFIGVLEDVETLEEFCCQLSKGTYITESVHSNSFEIKVYEGSDPRNMNNFLYYFFSREVLLQYLCDPFLTLFYSWRVDQNAFLGVRVSSTETNGIKKMKTLLFWIQEQYTNQKKRSLQKKRVAEIRSKYNRKFQVLDIDADLQTYAL